MDFIRREPMKITDLFTGRDDQEKKKKKKNKKRKKT